MSNELTKAWVEWTHSAEGEACFADPMDPLTYILPRLELTNRLQAAFEAGAEAAMMSDE